MIPLADLDQLLRFVFARHIREADDIELVAWELAAYQAFQRFDWTTPELLDLQILFLRASRVVDDRSLDLPMPLRGLIVSKLEKSGVPALQTAKIKGFVPIGRSDRASLYDESLPPGLILIE